MNRALLLALALSFSSPAIAAAPQQAARPSVNVLATPLRTATPGWAAVLGAGSAPLSAEPVARALAYRGLTPDAFAALPAEQRVALIDEAKAEAAASIQESIRAWGADGALDGASAGELLRIDASMKDILALPAEYAGPQRGLLEGSLRWVAQRRDALGEDLQMPSLVTEAGPQTAPTLARVEELETALAKAGRRKAGKLVGELREIGESSAASEEVRVAAAKALVEHLPVSFGNQHAVNVAYAALAVGLSAKSEAVNDVLVQGLAHDLMAVRSPLAVNHPARELQIMSALAQASGSQRVRAIASEATRSLAAPASLGQWMLHAKNSRSRKLTETATEILAASAVAGPIPSPGAWMAAPAPESAFSRVWRALKWSPLRTIGVLLAAGWFAPFSAFSAIPTAAALAFAFFAGSLLLVGLTRHKLLPAVVHVGLLAGVFAAASLVAAATGPLGLVGTAFTVGYAAVMWGLGLFGLSTERAWRAAAVSALLLGLF